MRKFFHQYVNSPSDSIGILRASTGTLSQTETLFRQKLSFPHAVMANLWSESLVGHPRPRARVGPKWRVKSQANICQDMQSRLSARGKHEHEQTGRGYTITLHNSLDVFSCFDSRLPPHQTSDSNLVINVEFDYASQSHYSTHIETMCG